MTTPLTITIDPGKGSGALAWCLGRGKIEAAGLVQGLDPLHLHGPVLNLCGLLRQHTNVRGLGVCPIQVYPERMQARGGQSAMHATAKAAALLDLALISGYLAGALSATLGATVHPVTYQQWSGGATETQVRNRLIGEDGALHPMEVCALDVKRYAPGLRHNLYDAAGMFMFATGRVRPGGW